MKVAIATLGCKVNQYESAGIREALETRGLEMVPFDQRADYYVINTCTVTSATDAQSRQMIRRAARTNPDAKIIVTGCYARLAAETLGKMPGVAMVTDEKAVIPHVIAAADPQPAVGLPEAAAAASDLLNLKPVRFHSHTRAFLKIQDGCNSRCRYCIIPRARGPSRSLPETEVIGRLKELRGHGFKEIVLTGIHLGDYGADLAPPTDLVRIVQAAAERRIVERLRLSSMEPMEIGDGLITLFGSSGMLCPHLHIPLQSGDDGILRRMGRPYDSAFFARLLEKIWGAVPDLAVGLDVMVGFPGEDRRAFERTAAFLENLPVAYLHVFPYSDRPGTEAASMSGKVSAADKKDRARQIRDIGRRKRLAFARRYIGNRMDVLVEEKPDRVSGLWRGYSGNYIPVLLKDGHASQVNQIVRVLAEDCREGTLYARTAQP